VAQQPFLPFFSFGMNASMAACAQADSAGSSASEIVASALRAAEPTPGLAWIDVGCGTGAALRQVRDLHQPARLTGIDIIDFLADDLRADVHLTVGPAEDSVATAEPADRVLMIETVEHLEAPWSVLRAVARLVKPGGILVVSTPNVASLRHRIELLVRGRLTAFRSDNRPHLTPVLPHVVARILEEEEFVPEEPTFAGRDVLPLTGGRLWTPTNAMRFPVLGNISVVHKAKRPRIASALASSSSYDSQG